jgi:hypothetical protein
VEFTTEPFATVTESAPGTTTARPVVAHVPEVEPGTVASTAKTDGAISAQIAKTNIVTRASGPCLRRERGNERKPRARNRSHGLEARVPIEVINSRIIVHVHIESSRLRLAYFMSIRVFGFEMHSCYLYRECIANWATIRAATRQSGPILVYYNYSFADCANIIGWILIFRLNYSLCHAIIGMLFGVDIS